MIYQISNSGVLFIEQWEGFIPHPYLDKAGVPTIGYGTTHYEDGTAVKLSDPTITKDRALELLKHFVNTIIIPVLEKHVTITISQNQVDSLCDFTYNEGSGAFIGSHLLVAINSNAGQLVISQEFAKWIYINHKPDQWQIKRRAAETKLYF